ncbi:uncharacterized protein [Linepithema humile]|uniref:uncharacterized protein n=1 Tax=Linepithema humile TaxID=83485 RepID=UPI00351F69EC
MKEEKLYAAIWCPVCDERVSVKGRDTCRLLTHVRKYHPKIADKRLDNPKNVKSKISLNRISSSGILITPADNSSSKKNKPKKIYATRVDTWKLHGERKVCPQCQREAIPTLHARGNKLTTSHTGALCLLGKQSAFVNYKGRNASKASRRKVACCFRGFRH